MGEEQPLPAASGSPGTFTSPSDPLPLGAADRLRIETKTAHVESERAAMEHLFRPAVLTRQRYATYLCGLQAIYAALETELARHHTHRVLGEIYFPELHRTAALADDLTYFARTVTLPSAPTAAATLYANHIQRLGEKNPTNLAAHVYTRYLGDLSGGQMLKNLIRRALHLEGEAGLQSLQFAQIPDLAAFKTMFRARLNAIPLSAPAMAELIAEARTSFALTRALFESLALPPPGL